MGVGRNLVFRSPGFLWALPGCLGLSYWRSKARNSAGQEKPTGFQKSRVLCRLQPINPRHLSDISQQAMICCGIFLPWTSNSPLVLYVKKVPKFGVLEIDAGIFSWKGSKDGRSQWRKPSGHWRVKNAFFSNPNHGNLEELHFFLGNRKKPMVSCIGRKIR